MNGHGVGRRTARTTTLLAVVGALAASLMVAVAPSASAVSVAPAATALDSTMDACLRVAANDPGGTLVMTDLRLSAYQAGRLAYTMRGAGRPTCVRRDRTFTVASAYAWWAGLPASRRPSTVVLAVRGTSTQFAAWAKDMPFRRLLGTSDSGISRGSVVTLWPRSATGATAGRAILIRLGELMLNAHAWAGTKASWLLTSSASQCAAAVASPKGVLLLGDSITAHDFAGAAKALAARGYVPCVYAQSSSRIYEHLARIAAGKVPLPKNVIIALGNNDIFTGTGGYPFRFRAQVTALMRRLPGHNIIFPTVWRTKNQPYLAALQHNCLVVNAVIRSIAKGQSNWRVPDWAAIIKKHPSLQFDGIHLSPTGLAMRYDQFADTLDDLTATPA